MNFKLSGLTIKVFIKQAPIAFVKSNIQLRLTAQANMPFIDRLHVSLRDKYNFAQSRRLINAPKVLEQIRQHHRLHAFLLALEY